LPEEVRFLFKCHQNRLRFCKVDHPNFPTTVWLCGFKTAAKLSHLLPT
jgi:hypothetical protein